MPPPVFVSSIESTRENWYATMPLSQARMSVPFKNRGLPIYNVEARRTVVIVQGRVDLPGSQVAEFGWISERDSIVTARSSSSATRDVDLPSFENLPECAMEAGGEMGPCEKLRRACVAGFRYKVACIAHCLDFRSAGSDND